MLPNRKQNLIRFWLTFIGKETTLLEEISQEYLQVISPFFLYGSRNLAYWAIGIIAEWRKTI